METKKITAVMILEIIGKPAEHLVETLEKITEEMGNEEGVKINNKKISEPTELKDRKDFFMTFAEIEIEVEEALQLAILMFKYMPAHVEVVSPESIILTNNEYGDILSELTRRLHKYDEVARVVQMEKGILEKKLREVLEKKEDK
ncbi:hypothetical protein KAT80_00905 [Candidatus Pacearchaeota archaeon]|nr:hypothetical protein [Candidatus Pacearchaeota archaeon]